MDEWTIAKRKVTIDNPTPEQVEAGLTDTRASERYSWAKRDSYTPTIAQIERGLTDEHEEIREVWRERDLDMNKKLLPLECKELTSNTFEFEDSYEEQFSI